MESTLAKLTSDYQKAIDEKVRCQQEADETTKTIALANRLVNGLASEKVEIYSTIWIIYLVLANKFVVITFFLAKLACSW